jgi:hypothetical protein
LVIVHNFFFRQQSQPPIKRRIPTTSSINSFESKPNCTSFLIRSTNCDSHTLTNTIFHVKLLWVRAKSHFISDMFNKRLLSYSTSTIFYVKFFWVIARSHFISDMFNRRQLSCFNKYNLSRQIFLSHSQIKLYFWYV